MIVRWDGFNNDRASPMTCAGTYKSQIARTFTGSSSASGHPHAAVDVDCLAGDVASGGGNQEQHQTSHFLGQANPPERNLGVIIGASILQGLFRHLRADYPRG